MFICALKPFVAAIIITLVVLQYSLAVFCLLKLAYLDIDKKQYVLWNILILVAVFIGSGIFLGYYFSHPELRIQARSEQENEQEQPEPEGEQASEPEGEQEQPEQGSEQESEPQPEPDQPQPETEQNKNTDDSEPPVGE